MKAMNKIILASNNQHKVEEIQQIVNDFEIVTLNEINFTDDVEETADTFEGNAHLKATTIFEAKKLPTLADDSGLEVEALNGAPGVFSKRYAGTERSEDNIKKLLQALEGKENRRAQFRTVLCYFDGNQAYYFEGIVKGEIITEKRGEEGFGYDPIFIPEGYDKTFAELGATIKNKISHRAIAVQKFSQFIFKKNKLS